MTKGEQVTMTAKPELKPGAYARLDDLEQATRELEVWRQAWGRLILDCRAHGWSMREIGEVAGISEQSVRDRVNGKVGQ